MKAVPKKLKVIPEKKVIEDEYAKTEKSGKRTIDPRPEFSVSEEIMPQIKDWSVGKKYRFEVEAEMTGSRIQDYGDDKGKLVSNFKISGIAEEEKEEKEKPSMAKVADKEKY